MEVIHKDPLLILEQYGLKKTNVRKLVLEVFLSVNHALSQPAVEETLGFVENRVTIYRVIKDMEAAGIIHRVVHLNGTVLFALCSDCSVHKHSHDQHVHFTCTNCDKIYCLDHFQLPDIEHPKGFQIETIYLNATGLCQNCNK